MLTQVDKAAMYARRRQRLMEQIDEGIAWINSAGESFDSGYCRNVEYLTGLRSPAACLVLAPRGILVEGIAHPGHYWCTELGPELGRGRRVKEALFVEEPSARYKGLAVQRQVPSIAEIRQQTGIDAVYGLSEMDEVLRQALMHEEVLWVNTSKTPELSEPVPPDIVRINQIKERFYWLQVKNIAPKIHAMRMIKEPYEIECLRMAYQITKEIIEKVMCTVKPGDNEMKVAAIFEYELKSRIDEGLYADLRMGFGPIVAAGERASTNEYWAGNQQIQDGDMILIDCGVSYNGYSADISRAWPANGKFTPRQRELYSILLEAQNLGLATMKPGSTCAQARAAVYNHFKKFGVERYGLGRNCHPVGLNTEDAYYFGFGDFGPFEPNQVWAFEPMLMMPAEGIGIRLEDGVLITEIGYELLPAPAREIEAVEALCRGAAT